MNEFDKLLTEISRVKEMMGVTLINEGIDDLVKVVTKSLDNFKSKAGRLPLVVSDLLDDFARASTNDEKLKVLGKLLDASDEIFDEVSGLILKENEQFIEYTINAAKKQIDKGVPLDVLKGKIERYYALNTGKQIPSTKLQNLFTAKTIDDVELYAGKGAGSAASAMPKLTKFLTDAGPKELQTYFRVWRRAFTSAKKLQEEFIEVANQAASQLAKGDDADAELKKMADILQATKKWFNNQPQKVWKDEWRDLLITQGRGDVVKEIESGRGYYTEFWDKLKKKEGFWEPYNDEWKAFKEAWPFRIPMKGNKTEGWFIFKSNPQTYRRLLNTIVYGDPRKISELVTSLRTKGVKGQLISSIVSRVVTHLILFPMLYSYFKTSTRAVRSWAEQTPELWNGEKWEFVDYGEEGGNEWEKFKSDFMKNYREMLPNDVSGVMNFTYADEAIEVGKEIFKKIYSGGMDDSEIEQLKDRANAEYEKFEETLPEEAKTTVEEWKDKVENKSDEPTETPITNPVEKEIRDNFPCAKKYPLKVISNTEVEFTDVSSGNEIIPAEKINGVWTWTNSGKPLKCNK